MKVFEIHIPDSQNRIVDNFDYISSNLRTTQLGIIFTSKNNSR